MIQQCPEYRLGTIRTIIWMVLATVEDCVRSAVGRSPALARTVSSISRVSHPGTVSHRAASGCCCSLALLLQPRVVHPLLWLPWPGAVTAASPVLLLVSEAWLGGWARRY